MTKLLAARYEYDDASSAILEPLGNATNQGIRWNAESGGTQRIEITVKAKNEYDVYARRAHYGQRLALYSSWAYRPISGYISEIKDLGGNRVQYIAKGPAWRLEHELVTDTFSETATISDTIESILTAYAPHVSSNYDNITTNATTLDGWQPKTPGGTTAIDCIQQLTDMGDSSDSRYVFYLVDEPFDGTNLGQYVAHYKKLSSDDDIDWQVSRKDLSNIAPSTDINDRITDGTVYYGLVSGTATGGTHTQLQDTAVSFIELGVKPDDTVTHVTAGGKSSVTSVDSATQLTLDSLSAKSRDEATGGSTTTLVDTAADFVTDGVRVGDKVFNDTDDETATVTAVTSLTTLTFSGGLSGGAAFAAGENYHVASRFASGDTYAIETKSQIEFVTDSVTTDLWDVNVAKSENGMSATQAAQYAAILVSDEADTRQPITIGAHQIMDGNGAKWPLWEAIAQGSGYLRINDLYPSAALFSDAMDRKSSFYLMALDYDGNSHKLTCTLDKPDTRLDVRLRRAKILNSEMVERY